MQQEGWVDAIPDSFIQLPSDGAGKKLRSFDRGTPGHDQYVIPTDPRIVTFRGRGATLRIPGRAGTTGQKIAAIHNATGSTVLVNVNRISVDLAVTAAKAVTVLPPLIRIDRFTVVPTGGTALPKVSFDTASTSNSMVMAYQDASADGVSSTLALAVTIPASSILTEEFAPQLITAAGYEPADRLTFFEGDPDIVLRALEGVVVELVYVLATQNPITDMWVVQIDWEEYTV